MRHVTTGTYNSYNRIALLIVRWFQVMGIYNSNVAFEEKWMNGLMKAFMFISHHTKYSIKELFEQTNLKSPSSLEWK